MGAAGGAAATAGTREEVGGAGSSIGGGGNGLGATEPGVGACAAAELPAEVPWDGSGVVRHTVAVGDGHGCWLDAGAVVCAYADDTNVATPHALAGLDDMLDLSMTDVGGGNVGCAVQTGGATWCWQSDRTGVRDVHRVNELDDVVQVSTGSGGGNQHRACAVRKDASVWCWDTALAVPAKVQGLGQAKQVAVAGYASCALLLDGTVRCWGTGTEQSRACPEKPQAVPGVQMAREIVLNRREFIACALLESGAGQCWGPTYERQATNLPPTYTNTRLLALAQDNNTFTHIAIAKVDAAGSASMVLNRITETPTTGATFAAGVTELVGGVFNFCWRNANGAACSNLP